jgi:succinoglycan biosynthesis transport protein ExoP
MSKNFELMQQAALRPAATEVNRGLPERSEEKNVVTEIVRLNFDSAARVESLKLVQNIFLLGGQEPPHVVVFAGIDSGNGCSSICAHTAEILASHNLGAVCLIDANLRSPSLPEMFGVSNHHGLTDALRNNNSIRDFVKPVGPDNLWLLSCGALPPESISLLNSEYMKARMTDLRKEFHYVLIDAPPLNTCGDGFLLGRLSDGLVLVLEANSTRREIAAKVTEKLRAAEIGILGAVLNKRTFPIPKPLYNLL